MGFVHFQEVIVRAKDDGEFADDAAVCLSKRRNPRFDFTAVRTAKRVIGIVKL